ncbi:MAG: transporter [Desulfatiglandales bacterium]
MSTFHSGIIEMVPEHIQKLETDHPMVVELLSGERLIGRIVLEQVKRLIVHSPVLGDKTLSLFDIASVERHLSSEKIDKRDPQGETQDALRIGETGTALGGIENNLLPSHLESFRGRAADTLKTKEGKAEKSIKESGQMRPVGQRPEDEEDIRRLFLRQSSVLLKTGEKELELGCYYLGNQLPATIYNARFRQFQLPVALRLGILSRLEGFISVPLIHARQELTFADEGFCRKTSGIGDTLLGINYEMFRETAFWPDIVSSLSLRAPTGDEPDEEGMSTGSGHWSGSLGVQFIKTADPVVLFWGLRYTHEFPATYFLNDGIHEVRPGETIDYNLGFGFAVNEKISLGTQISGSYQGNTRTDGGKISGSSREPVTLRSALSYRISRKTFIEPSLAIGLNDETADYVIGIAAVRRFAK